MNLRAYLLPVVLGVLVSLGAIYGKGQMESGAEHARFETSIAPLQTRGFAASYEHEASLRGSMAQDPRGLRQLAIADAGSRSWARAPFVESASLVQAGDMRFGHVSGFWRAGSSFLLAGWITAALFGIWRGSRPDAPSPRIRLGSAASTLVLWVLWCVCLGLAP